MEQHPSARLDAPVTNRGEAIGVLELFLRDAPYEQVLAHAPAYVVIASRRILGRRSFSQDVLRAAPGAR